MNLMKNDMNLKKKSCLPSIHSERTFIQKLQHRRNFYIFFLYVYKKRVNISVVDGTRSLF